MTHSVINTSLISHNETIIVGLSGGPDSVYLLYQLIELQKIVTFTIVAAHLNHEWRKTAIRDELFCKTLCAQLNITFVSARISDLLLEPPRGRSKEHMARCYRKYFLESIKQKHGATKIFVAHHKDDQIETFFIKLIRGTSVEGLSCLQEINGDYYRPLLHIAKKEILEYLNAHDIQYMHDETNDDNSFLRNNIRHNLIPTLQQIDNRAENNIIKAINDIQEVNHFLDEYIQEQSQVIIQNNTLLLDLLIKEEYLIQKKIVLNWLYSNECEFNPSQAFVHELFRFLISPRGGTHQMTESWTLVKKEKKILIKKQENFV